MRINVRYLALAGVLGCGDNRPGTAPPPDAPASVRLPSGSTARFGVFETTDLHTNVRSFDYFKLVEDKSIGLERTATLIRQAQQELPDSILVDNGDTIQGTVMADYQALVAPIGCTSALGIYKVMNALGYDVAGIGNHEFNYGLSYLAQVTHTAFDVIGVETSQSAGCGGPAFPQILTNVYSAKTNAPLFRPSTIIQKLITATLPDGTIRTVPLKIGVMAFTPPGIMSWDKRWLDGKVYTKGVQELAAATVAQLRADGADLVVAIIHGGLDNAAYTPDLENQGWYLAQVPGIDALLLGHSHQIFPNPTSTVAQFALPEVDKAAGTVAGVPTVMANFWGQHLGVIQLDLERRDGRWAVGSAIIEARPISTTCMAGAPLACPAGTWRTGAACTFASSCTNVADKTKVYVDADPAIAPLVAAEHDGTIAYVRTPVGTTDFEMSTLFAEEGEVGAIQVVNQAQADYVSTYIAQNLPQYATLPVLSVSAPFKSGFQGGNDYTDVPAGNIAINNVADLYLFANTLYAVKVTGAELTAWLEKAATRFATIDPMVTADQPLINPAVPGFNFDVVTDARLTYDIDITKPLPAMNQPATGRIKNLKFQGVAIDPAQQFIVATNNYRASGGGGFPGLDGSKSIYASPDTNRDILIRYIKAHPALTRVANGVARSWHFMPVTTAGRVVFRSAQNALPKAVAAGLTNISLIKQDDGSGTLLSLYAIDLAH